MLPPLLFLLETGPIIDPPDPPAPVDPDAPAVAALSREFSVNRGDLRLAPPEQLDVDDLRVSGDFGIVADDLETDEGLETAVQLSLFTNRRAEEGDRLPYGQSDRQGWFGDDLSEIPGDRFGSRLWLLMREKEMPLVLVQAEEYAREALQWLITDLVASRVTVTASAPRTGWLDLQVEIYRPDGTVRRYDYTWEAQALRGE